MEFKKITLTVSLLASATIFSINANANAASDVTLQGVITNSICDIAVNHGKSLLNVGVFKSSEFTANVSTAQVDLPVSLTDCAAGEDGTLIIQGLTSTGNAQQNIFVGNEEDTVGFMVAQNDGTTNVANGQGAPLTLGAAETSASYTFKVGMASTTLAPLAGAYSAPILVAYIVE